MTVKFARIFPYSIIVIIITLAIYLISYNGIPVGSDEELYASVTRNLALNRTMNADQLYGNHRIPRGYHGVEPAFPALASLWYSLITLFPVGKLQGLYLLPIILTAITNGLIVILAFQLGYSIRAGVVAGLLFGLSTMAWVYTKYFYRETLLCFLFILAWLCFEFILTYRAQTKLFWGGWIILVILLGIIILTKVMAVAFIGALCVLFIYQIRLDDLWNRNFVISAGIFLLGILILIGYLSLQKTTDSSVFYRYTGSFISDALGRFQSLSYDHFWEAIFAPLISPWKGIFIYSPPCILACFSLFEQRSHKSWRLFALLGITTIGFVLIQALAYNDEWWTGNWGSRFLLPTIPLFIITALPWLEITLHGKNIYRKLILILVGLIGNLSQWGAIIFHSAIYDFSLSSRLETGFPDRVIWSISNAPLWGQWSLVFDGIAPALLVWRILYVNPFLSVAAIFAGIGLSAWLGYALFQSLKTNEISTRDLYTKACIGLSGVLAVFMLTVYASTRDPFYYSEQFANPKLLCSQLRSRVKASDLVVVKPYRGDVWYYFMNDDCVTNEWYSLPFSIDIGRVPAAKDLTFRFFREETPNSDRVWLVNQVWNNDNYINELLLENGFNLIEETDYFLPDSRATLGFYER